MIGRVEGQATVQLAVTLPYLPLRRRAGWFRCTTANVGRVVTIRPHHDLWAAASPQVVAPAWGQIIVAGGQDIGLWLTLDD